MPIERHTVLQKKLSELRREGEERETKRLAEESGYSYVDLRTTPVSVEAVELIPRAVAEEARAAAIQIKARDVAVVAVDPSSMALAEILKTLESKGYKTTVFVVSASSLEQVWPLYRFVREEAGEITGKVAIAVERLEDLSRRLVTLDAVRAEIQNLDFKKLVTAALFEIILSGALANRASDIHLEAEEKDAKIRLRIDGILHDAFHGLPKHTYEALLSRIKLLAELKINIRTEAQDGRFTIALTKKEVEVRVSVIPSEFGETAVMRLLDPETIAIGLAGLGLRDDNLALIEREIQRPNGLILNTGPTGSGKTTTLYACLEHVNKPDIKVITIEDPIEYHLAGIEQTQVDPKTGYTFANGLRSILRQDPDVLLVGEIRDLETADIALQAALTGHLVFSTLHTNDAVGAVPRLIDLGVKVLSIGPAASLIIAQRLVRKLCAKCKKQTKVTSEVAGKLKRFLASLPERVNRVPYEKPMLYEPVGCAECNGIGYRGRIAIFEFLEAGPEFEKIILKDPSEVAMRELAERQGMVTMQQDGILKVIAGLTSFKEVENVTGSILWR